MTYAQLRNRLTTHFSERIPVFKRRMSVAVLHRHSNVLVCVAVCARQAECMTDPGNGSGVPYRVTSDRLVIIQVK